MEEPPIQPRLSDRYAQHRRDHPGEHVVDCGLIDEAAYRAAPFRMVWLLKEPVDESQSGGWTLPGYFHDVALGRRPPSRTARPLGVLSAALLDNQPTYASAYSRMGAGLRRIGVTNMKKSGGGSASSWTVIGAAAERDAALWQEELRIMAPDVVVCGGTFWHADRLLPLRERHTATSGAWVGVWESGQRPIAVVEGWHPANWACGRERALERLRGTVSEARLMLGDKTS